MHVNESCHTYEWVMSHLWTRHATHMNESCHTYEWVVSHIWMSHVTHMNESCHTYEWVMSHIWMRYGTYMNDSLQTHEWVMSRIWMRRVCRNTEEPVHSRHIWLSRVSIYMNESCHTYEWVMPHIWMSHTTHMDRWCHTYECVIGAGMPKNQCTHGFRRKLCKRETFVCTRVEEYRIIWIMWLLISDVSWGQECRKTSAHTTHMNESGLHMYEWVVSHVWMSHVTHMNESRHTHG